MSECARLCNSENIHTSHHHAERQPMATPQATTNHRKPTNANRHPQTNIDWARWVDDVSAPPGSCNKRQQQSHGPLEHFVSEGALTKRKPWSTGIEDQTTIILIIANRRLDFLSSRRNHGLAHVGFSFKPIKPRTHLHGIFFQADGTTDWPTPDFRSSK